MQDSPRSKWLGCSHVPSPSSPSRNLENGGWISLNSSTSLVSTASPSVSSRIGKGRIQDHDRGIAVAPSGVTVAGPSGLYPPTILSSNGSATLSAASGCAARMAFRAEARLAHRRFLHRGDSNQAGVGH